MIRLEKLYIKGFKQPNREVTIEFSKEPITVIYGGNGSGKTTLLKILQAIFKEDYNFIAKQGITVLKIAYRKNNAPQAIEIKFRQLDNISIFDNINEMLSQNEEIISTEDSSNRIGSSYTIISTNGKKDDLNNTKSLFIGEHRGLLETSSMKNFFARKLIFFLQEISVNPSLKKELDKYQENVPFARPEAKEVSNLEFIQFLKNKAYEILDVSQSETDEVLSNQNHTTKNFTTIKSIEQAILNKQEEGNKEMMEKSTSAFFEAIDDFASADQSDNNFDLPTDIKKRITYKKDFIQATLAQQNTSKLKNILEQYIETFDKSLLETKIYRALLLSILEKAEEPNSALDSVNKLIKMFSDHLYYDKKLVVDNDRVYIDIGDGHSHDLEELSSGERNFLSMLTLFLVLGQDRDFLIIDEPEISMNLKWQREFLPMISELNPQAQIIVASHSPAIASKNSNYLVELNPKKITDEI